MKITVINETSAADRNVDILKALEGTGHEIINVGMTKNGENPELSYIHTGLMTALLLNLNSVDFVVGGCGTGQGYLNSVMQYPGVFCGHILTPLDAWLFAQINGGNCISLALNQGYGWAAGVKLKFIFERIFSVEKGCGYPEHRKIPQKESRIMLNNISNITHRKFSEIINKLPDEIVKSVLDYPRFKKLLEMDSIKDIDLRLSLQKKLEN